MGLALMVYKTSAPWKHFTVDNKFPECYDLDSFTNRESCMNQSLIDRVLTQIVKDVSIGDLTAIEELLSQVPDSKLENYLPESVDIKS